ncbi:MAG: Gamma-glutamyl phosphate reductase [Firmicutes bacterium ADurb.Bin080]|nr:glutamate-5-semialdehyde dehydrogenase [Clostridiales bacterium]OQC14508.1 MAG: Gamma-glutamyl phosphate reductase [Firmicutes bacterium ADurb.Bin080]
MSLVANICENAKKAANTFAGISKDVKNSILLCLKNLIEENCEMIISANKKDLLLAKETGRNQAFLDRLTLTNQRIKEISEGLDAIISLKDPVGEIVEEYVLPNGLNVKKTRAPLGVIAIIFEARPNVAIDAAALCIKSGNGVILRGSKDSTESVNILVSLIKKALEENGISENLVGLIDSSDRSTSVDVLKQDKYIDVVIPRGGESLKKVVLENATMPVIASAGGNCHIYVSKTAKIDLAKQIVINSKTNRPAVCNALETLLVDKSVATSVVPLMCSSLLKEGVEIRVSERAKEYYPQGIIVTYEEMYKEYDDLIIKIEVVDGIDEAISHINHFGTHHSDGIISEDVVEIEKFMKEVDSSALYLNASTRFTDGFQLGLGAEMGISTQKLHVRGPIGLKELTSTKYCVYGNGQIRN